MQPRGACSPDELPQRHKEIRPVVASRRRLSALSEVAVVKNGDTPSFTLNAVIEP